MASPTDAGRASTNTTTAALNLAVNMPATVNAGDVLLAIGTKRNGNWSTTPPSGWTFVFVNANTAAFVTNPNQTFLAYKVADGSEDGTTVTFNGTTNVKHCAISYCISGAADPASTAIDVSAIGDGDGDSTTPDPGNVNVTGGPKDVLFIWLGTWMGEQTSPPSGQPTNYSNPFGSDTGTAGSADSNGRIAAASRQVSSASSEDPGSWTISASNAWWSWTLAIHPAAGGGGTPGPATLQSTRRRAANRFLTMR